MEEILAQYSTLYIVINRHLNHRSKKEAFNNLKNRSFVKKMLTFNSYIL